MTAGQAKLLTELRGLPLAEGAWFLPRDLWSGGLLGARVAALGRLVEASLAQRRAGCVPCFRLAAGAYAALDAHHAAPAPGGEEGPLSAPFRASRRRAIRARQAALDRDAFTGAARCWSCRANVGAAGRCPECGTEQITPGGEGDGRDGDSAAADKA